MKKKVNKIIIENAKILFRNFAGEETRFNPKGRRNFSVIIDDPEYAEMLTNDGWNIKTLPPREEGDTAKYYLQVTVNFENVPPKVIMVTNKSMTPLDSESIGTLDYADIINVDLTITPYHWEVNGKDGIKAYLKTMYVTIDEDEFADKYADI